jgi:hypothetical protein
MGDRRRVAVAIRVRQEAQKRLAAWLPGPTWRPDQSIASVLRRDSVALDRADAPESLRRLTVDRWPRIPDSDGTAPSDASALLAEVEQILCGDWMVFDRRIHVGSRGPDWRRHPLSGQDTPLVHFSRLGFHGAHVGGDIKYLWEINRHAELVRLAQGYLLTRSEAMAEAAVGMLERWWDENPPGIGLNWLSALEVAFRLVAWCYIWQYTQSSDAWSSVRVRRLLVEVSAACRFVRAYDSVHHSPNTHLTGEAMGVLYAASLFQELRGAGADRAWAIATLRAEVPHQFLRDGMHFERATGYHRYHTEFYLHATAIARHGGESWHQLWDGPLRLALDASAALRRPDDRWPVIGDEDGGAMAKLWSGDACDQGHLLALGARLFGEPRWACRLSPRHAALPWWLLGAGPDASAAKDATPPQLSPSRTITLPHAGYLGAADERGWYVLVDVGPHGGNLTGHAHTDVGHVEVCHGARPILLDSGCAVYTADEERRNWYRSLAAHATVMVNGDRLADPSSAFGWARIAPTPQGWLTSLQSATTIHLRYSAPSGQWQHERVVVLVHSIGVLIADFISGRAVERVQWNWPVGSPESLVVRSGGGPWIEAGAARLHWAASAPLTASVVPTRTSPTYGIERAGYGLRTEIESAAAPLAAALAVTAEGYVIPQLVVLPDRVLATFPGVNAGASIVVEVCPGGLPVVVNAALGDC